MIFIMRGLVFGLIVILMATIIVIDLQNVFAQESLTCPKGSYHGLDNNGNDACRDIKTNAIVKQ